MSKPIAVNLGIKNPTSVDEYREAVVSSQTTLASVMAFNIISDLVERVAALEAQLAEAEAAKTRPVLDKAPAAKTPTARKKAAEEPTAEDA